MDRLAQEFRSYHRGGLYPKREGKYELVLPVSEERTRVALQDSERALRLL